MLPLVCKFKTDIAPVIHNQSKHPRIEVLRMHKRRRSHCLLQVKPDFSRTKGKGQQRQKTWDDFFSFAKAMAQRPVTCVCGGFQVITSGIVEVCNPDTTVIPKKKTKRLSD